MEDICNSIRDVLELDRQGGELVLRDEATVILVDHEVVTFHALYMISTLHPNLHISTHATDSGRSGFMVVFSLNLRKHVLCSAPAILYTYTSVCLICCVVLALVPMTPHWVS